MANDEFESNWRYCDQKVQVITEGEQSTTVRYSFDGEIIYIYTEHLANGPDRLLLIAERDGTPDRHRQAILAQWRQA